MTTSASVTSLGIGSGIDLQSLLDGLMKAEAAPQTALKNKVSSNQSNVSVYQALNTKFAALEKAAQDLNLPSSWKINKATSSDASVTATASGSAISGTFSFKVTQLAAANVMASSGTVSSLNSVIGSGRFVSGSAASLGISSMTASSDFESGPHSLDVTQASQAATIAGSAVSASTVIDATNNTLSFDINGQSQTLTLANGTYTRQQLADAVNTAASGAGVGIKTTLAPSGSLNFATTRQGSQATLTMTGGSAAAALGITGGATATGTDGIVDLDGVTTTITNTDNPVTINSTTGSITATISGGLKSGTQDFGMVDFGDGTLSSVVNAINSAGGNMTAAAVQVSPGQYKLQLASTETGTANALTIDPAMFSGSGLGTLQTVTAASDATLSVGSGPGAYTITSSTNTITDALPGVTIDVSNSTDATKTVTLKVGGDVDALADKVKALVDAANGAASFIKTNSSYDASTKRAGALLGDSVASRLQQMLFSNTLNPVNGAAFGASNVGITSDGAGGYKFDSNAFKAAYAKNPEAVASVFVEGGTQGVATPTNPGIAERLAKLGDMATNSVDGIITTSIKGLNTLIENLNKQISDWDDRLAKKKSDLQRQFSALDTTIANLKNQSNWLAGQVAGLPTGSS